MTSIQKSIVAIIDNNPDMRKGMASLLSAFGYVTHVFNSAEAFLSIAATSTAKCLVVDVQLGDVSGVELARQLADTGFTFPIIFMTAADDEAIWSQIEQLGSVACLRKPFRADLLIEAIVRAIGHPA